MDPAMEPDGEMAEAETDVRGFRESKGG